MRISYNKTAQMLKLIPVTADNAQGFDFEIKSSLTTFGGDSSLEITKVRYTYLFIRTSYSKIVQF